MTEWHESITPDAFADAASRLQLPRNAPDLPVIVYREAMSLEDQALADDYHRRVFSGGQDVQGRQTDDLPSNSVARPVSADCYPDEPFGD